jgi:hypothetical protein
LSLFHRFGDTAHDAEVDAVFRHHDFVDGKDRDVACAREEVRMLGTICANHSIIG